MKKALLAIAVVMLILHQDFWLWEDSDLFLGFLPAGLAYHAAYSIGVALLALLSIRYAWPHNLERWAKGQEDVKANLNAQRYHIR